MRVPATGLYPVLTLVGCLCALSTESAAQTRQHTATLPNYNGPVHFDPPFPSLTIGTFTYTLFPGESITAATISGTWGNSSRPQSSAGVDLFLDGLLVARCVAQTTCFFDAPPDLVPWSFTYAAAQLSSLQDGQAAFTGQQTSSIQVYLGSLALALTINSPPILTVRGAGTGSGTITGTGINCTITNGVASGSCQSKYALNTSVVLTATPTGGSTFNGWSESCSGTGSCTVVMSQTRAATASFTAPGPQTLTVSGGGTGSGTVTSQAGLAPAINCTITNGVASGTCSQSYPFNTSVTLTAAATGGGTFSGWSNACTGTGTCALTMSQARNVTASFTAPPQTLTVSGGGTGSGTVTSQAGLSPAINCTITNGVASGACSQSYPFNTSVTLTAAATGGGTFSGWSNACTGTGTCALTMSQARNVTASFTAPAQTLTVTGGGTGSGTVTSQAGLTPAINCTITNGAATGACSQSYPFNTSVTLTATATGGGTFTGWSGACTGTGSCVLTMSQARNVTASFTAAPQTLTVTGGGTGSGTVLSQVGLTPAINCVIANGVSSGSCSQSYPFNTSVTLTAATAVNSTFSGWSGACTGTGNCTLAMTQARNVTATFASGTITITGLTPNRGSTEGGTSVRVNGANFVPGGTSVTVRGVAATSVVVQSATELSFVTPAGSPGAASVMVATANASGTGSFTYVVPDSRRLAGARRPSFSFDGRYVAFESAVALVADDTNGVSDVYVFDKIAGTLRRVSVSSAGAQALGGESQSAAINATGRFVAFESRATNLVASDGNDLLDVFLHDRDSDNDGVFDEPGAIRTVRVSVNTAGAEGLQGFSRHPSISGNGRWVTFESAATNLVGSDTNGLIDICVHDRLLGITKRLNIHSSGSQSVGGDSARPVISLDGRYVAFDSLAGNLVAGDINGRRDVFVHDRDTDGDGVMDEAGVVATERVSVSSSEQEAIGGDSTDASITENGRYVAFGSTATNLVPNDTNGVSDIFLRDRLNGTTVRLSVGPGGTQFTGPSRVPRISANGAKLVFLTADTNAPPSGTVTAAATAIDAPADDGKSAPGVIPSPTDPQPPPPSIQTPPPNESTEDPNLSGDGSEIGSTAVPVPGSGGSVPSIDTSGVAEAADEPPFISGLAPASGPIAGGQIVEIHGAHFAPGSTVRWGAQTLAPLAGGTSALLRVSAPATGAAQPFEVQVRSGTLSSNVVTYTYQVALSAPTIASVNPATGPVSGQQAVTITGSGFATPSVRFGPLAGTVTGSTPTSISVTTPAAILAGPVPVVVTNQDGGMAVSDGPFSFTPVSGGAPTIAAVTPNHAPITGGTAVTILGSQFTPDAAVLIGGVAATQVQFLSSAALVATVPAGAAGPTALTVTVPGLPAASAGFTYDVVQQTVAACAGADQDLDGVPDAWETQYGLSSSDASDGALDWDGDGRTNLQECQDSTHPRGLYTRYLAEGATGSFFSTRVAIVNPGLMPARVLFRFLTSSGVTVPYVAVVPGGRRHTIDLETLAGLESANISTVIESDAEVVIDRTMRWDQATRGGAHAEASVPAPALRWYLAEGATHGAFDLFYLIQNPNLTSAASVRVRFLLPSGAPIEQFYTVAANSRFTLPVDGVAGLEATDVSAVIDSLNGIPVIVERAMYSSAAGVFAAGHNSAGVTSLSTQWFFAEGATGSFFDLFLLFANPNASDAQVRAVYLLPNGTTVSKDYTVPANRRRTINVAFEDPKLADTAVSATLTSLNGVPFIAERAMWWPHGPAWHEAHNSAGSTVTGTKWAVADGEQGAGAEATQTYLLVANTSAAAAHLRVTVLLENGAPLIREYTVAGNSRFNVPVGSDFSLPAGTRFGAIVESLGATPAQIVVERAMYWNAGPVIWAAGSNLLASKLQ
jgi:hypothetical protein